LHIAAHHGRLDCLKELHPHIPSTIPETDSLYLATDKVTNQLVYKPGCPACLCVSVAGAVGSSLHQLGTTIL